MDQGSRSLEGGVGGRIQKLSAITLAHRASVTESADHKQRSFRPILDAAIECDVAVIDALISPSGALRATFAFTVPLSA